MSSTYVLIVVPVAALVALAAFTFYRWRQRERVRGVEAWVKDYLSARFGAPLGHLKINCTDDPLWPVLVAFVHPVNGSRHSLQFICQGPPAGFYLLTESQSER